MAGQGSFDTPLEGPMASPEEYIYGINSVVEAISAHPEEVTEILLARDRRDPRLRRLLDRVQNHQIKVHPRPTHVLSQLAGNDHHQGVVAVVRGFQYMSLEATLQGIPEDETPLLLLLDGIQDPGNLGALIRSAHVLGAHGVIIPKNRAAGVTPTVRKASAGAAAHLPVVQVTNLARTMVNLFKKHGMWMVGLDQMAEQSLPALDLTVPLGLVIGGEGKGLRELTQKRCQLLGKIPQMARPGEVDSLNASAAGAVALFEVARQRSSTSS